LLNTTPGTTTTFPFGNRPAQVAAETSGLVRKNSSRYSMALPCSIR
jgi:hypothetical protein